MRQVEDSGTKKTLTFLAGRDTLGAVMEEVHLEKPVAQPNNGYERRLARRLARPTPEQIQEELRRLTTVPPGMLSEAIAKTHRLLRAKEWKFFSFQGEPTAKVAVDALDIQLRAAQDIQKMAGIYGRPEDKAKNTAPVTMEIDPVTGTIRIVVGGELKAARVEEVDDGMTIDAESMPGQPPIKAEVPHEVEPPQTEPDEEEPTFIKIGPGRLPSEIQEILFGPKKEEGTK